MKKRLISMTLAAILILTLFAACGSDKTPAADEGSANVQTEQQTPTQNEQPADPGDPVKGGTLKVTINSDATTLDAMMTSEESCQIPAWHIFEPALSADAGGNVWPGVCDYTFENNVLTLTVRDGVTFHNGDAVTIQDVEASAKRWTENVSAAKKQIVSRLASMEVVDNSLVITLTEVAPLALQTIAAYDQGLAVIPASICEKYGADPISDEADLIGTGPYQFVEHRPDQYILLKRYEGYVASENTDANGMAAPKMAYCDEIYFYPVGDKTTRITGVQTGEYDVGIGVPFNMLTELKNDPNLTVVTSDLGIMASMIFNNAKGPCSDVNLRNAILACLDMDELMLAAQGDESLYRLNPCFMMTSSRWYVEESNGKYNAPDLEKAKEYLAASSYNNETLVFITTSEYDYFYNTAILVEQMVEQIGIQVDVQVYDNSTLKEYRSNPDKFDIFSAGMSAKNDPTQIAFMDESWAGNWSNDKKDALLDIMSGTDDFDTRYDAWVQLQQLIYEEVPNVTFGERINPIVTHKSVHNLFETTQKYYWNTWKDAQ